MSQGSELSSLHQHRAPFFQWKNSSNNKRSAAALAPRDQSRNKQDHGTKARRTAMVWISVRGQQEPAKGHKAKQGPSTMGRMGLGKLGMA